MPPWAAAILRALHFKHPDTTGLQTLRDEQWKAALDFCDRARLTLVLRDRARDAMPEWVRERTDRNAAKNRQRTGHLLNVYRTLDRQLGHLDFLVLKGITQTTLSGGAPETRVQYDIDLYAPKQHAVAARDLLVQSGYTALNEFEDFPSDHLPSLVKKTGWEWRGDFFDPEIPSMIEVHFRFWNPEAERLEAPGADDFWRRRIRTNVAGLDVTMLHPVDGLGYTALHVLRHLLRGSVAAYSVYELALMLAKHAADEGLWESWTHLHSPQLQRLETVSFCLARAWFGCDTGPAVAEAIARQPRTVSAWFKGFSTSPLKGQFRPNKDELWLHLGLLESAADRWHIARERLLPSRLPGPVDGVYLQESAITWRRRCLKRIRQALYVAGRVRHHAMAFPSAAGSGARWWVLSRSRGGSL
jgi:hypothetical protein